MTLPVYFYCSVRVYQCIHKYGPHIPFFEKKYGVTDDVDFETLRALIVEDGYASVYVLLPALEHKNDEVFFTVWDYDRLQLAWARENGLTTADLDEIKLAQIEQLQPDVFYNFSAFADGEFINKLGKKKNRIDLCWNAIIKEEPRTRFEYDGHITLHRPFVEKWRMMGLAACELQPAIPPMWIHRAIPNRTIDVLFYGVYERCLHNSRNSVVDALIDFKKRTWSDIRCHLEYWEQRPALFPKVRWPRWPIVTFPPKAVRHNASRPLYGDSLYDAISRSRIVVNGYSDNNHEFKSNMRLFEVIGLGAFLISEEGNYPDGFEPGVDFYTYRSIPELIAQIERVLADWPKHCEIARRSQRKIAALYSKQRQWNEFQKFITSLC